MKSSWLFALFFLSMAQGEAAELVISAASSLTDSLNVLKGIYQSRHPDETIFFNFGASGSLEKQIEGGAPVDLFVSASVTEMEALQRRQLILEGSRNDLLSNEIVLIVPRSNHASIQGFSDLWKAHRLVMGDPGFVPAGQYAKEVLKFQGLFGLLEDRLVYGDNVRQVLEYVARGEVDAGLVFSTDALIMKDRVRIVTAAPKGSHEPILYPVAILRLSTHPQEAREFLNFISGPEGREVFSRFGFRIVGGHRVNPTEGDKHENQRAEQTGR
ncbi:molybdate ABC transporter substrate-binding protein [Ferrovum sp.]|uniref:molybdate ABC transporter substrate-binding protein n=1 Tax=Ferrovum sp. TaxID=2609467 RepID=UPI0026122223|nr:molybdate ABC transporter substrate-binding protein [Ferrovum sp.]